MKKIVFIAAIALAACSPSKKTETAIRVDDVQRIEAALSHDSMQGRLTFTAGNEKAAAFIANEMKQTGLQTFGNANGYLQTFEMLKPVMAAANATIENNAVPSDNIICTSPNENIVFTESSNYKLIRVHKGDNLRNAFRALSASKENTLVLIDSSFGKNFKMLRRDNMALFANQPNKVYVLTDNADAGHYSINIHQTINKATLSNVVGLLPGKSKPNEYVIFSGHYDHLGIGKPDSTGDSLYNGANDDASGITAMLSLAKHYKTIYNNERSIIFVAFTAEEVGGFGSKYFSEHLNADSVMAMFNIEMIGTDSKWGLNSAYITGYEKSDMGKILQKNLEGSPFKFYPDPYPEQQLFYRSDNATLARKGVPAHTISTSKMDNEPHYHKASDEIQTLDMKNMTEVIKSIAVSAQSIVSGKDTPTRVDSNTLQR